MSACVSSPLAGGDQQADSHADAHSDQQSTYFAEHLGIFFARKSIGGAAQTFGRGLISLPGPHFDDPDRNGREVVLLARQR